MRRNTFILTVIFILSLLTHNLGAQKITAEHREEVISTFKNPAQMINKDSNIPVSIVMAQAILETNWLTSELSVKGRNCFGIKCHGNWGGETLIKSDDKPDDCFRIYDTYTSSFIDYGEFLKRNHYKPLFLLPANDYRAWAHGLQQLGYATDEKYPEKLINIIETYNLHHFDLNNTVSTSESQYAMIPTLMEKPSVSKIADTSLEKEEPSEQIGASNVMLANNEVPPPAVRYNPAYRNKGGEEESNNFTISPKLEKEIVESVQIVSTSYTGNGQTNNMVFIEQGVQNGIIKFRSPLAMSKIELSR